MKRFKDIILFSTLCLLLITVLNLFGFVVCELTPYLFNEYTLFEYLFAGLIHLIFIFILVLIGGVRLSFIYVPIIYLALSVLVFVSMDVVSSWDFMFLLNFSFSRIIYAIYFTIKQIGILDYSLASIIVFNGLFFVYQMGLLFITKKLLYRFKMKINTNAFK